MPHVSDSDPYPWPYDDRLDGDRLALLITGAQVHWLARSTEVTSVLATLTRLAVAVRRAGGTCLAIRHGVSPSLAATGRRPHLPAVGTDAWQLGLGDLRVDHVVDASGLDGFTGSELDPLLHHLGRDHLLLGGFASEATVDSTLRSANDRGFECLVVTDGCAPFDPVLGARAHSSVTMSGGIFGAIGRSDAVIAALSGSDALIPSTPRTAEAP